MKKLIIGIVLVVLGLPWTAIFFPNLLQLILGGLPVLLVLGGALAVYLGGEEVMAQKEMDALPPLQDEPQADITDTKAQEDTKNQENAKDEAVSTIPSPEPPLPSAAPPAPQADPDTKTESAPKAEPAPEPEPAFAGNTDSFVFHSLSCAFSKGKKCTARFTTRDEAMEQGYKPCKICSP